MLTFNDLRPSQRRLIDFGCDGEDAFYWATIGGGKTAIGLAVMDHKLKAHEVSRWLVLAPKRVARDVWPNEPRKWDFLKHLNPINIAGRTPEDREAIVAAEHNQIVVMNYENLQWLLNLYEVKRKNDPLPFDGLLCDEIDKLKSVSSDRFKALRNRVKRFNSRIGMSGTPRPNHLSELWAPTYIVAGGDIFGRSFYKWRKQYFYPVDYNQHQWAPFINTEAEVLSQLDGVVAIITDDELDNELPDIVELPPRYTELPTSIRKTYKRLEKELYVLLYDKKGKKRAVDAPSRGALTGKLQQICAGFSYVPPDECTKMHGGSTKVKKNENGDWQCEWCNYIVPNDVIWHSRARFDELADLLSELQGAQCLIVYHFVEELRELRRRYPGIAYLGHGVSDKKADEYVEQFRNGEIDKLALHPASAGHGLDGLQDAGAQHLIFLTLPWSGGLYKQTIGRLRRGGAIVDNVLVHRILNRNTIDEDVAAEASARLIGNENTIDAMRARLGSNA